MSLKFKRYYPILLLLVAILSFLAFVMGDQPIAAYSVQATGQPTGQAATTGSNTASWLGGMVGEAVSQAFTAASQGGGPGEIPYANSDLVGTELL